MEFGFVIPAFGTFADPAVMADLVVLGEELGFAHVWFGDHVVVPSYAAKLTDPGWLDPLTCCSMGLARTSRIRFGTDVVVASYRHPALVAKMVATADHLSGGRMILGVGIGYLRGEFEILGASHAERAAVTDEHLEVLRLLWESDGAVVEHDGDHFPFRDAVFGPAPHQRPMPLWVGGNAPAALRRAATRGTGWHPLFPTPQQYAAGRAEIERLRGTTAEPFTYSYSCGVTTLLDHTPAAHVAETWAEQEGVPDDFQYAPPLPLADDGRLRFVGTPDDVASDIAEYAAVGVQHMALRFSYGGPDASIPDFVEQLRWFAGDVAPRFTT
jgi:probable F420-dependent oxidoreductase